MTICCLGDLVLDVIVRLEQPLATGADATSRIVLRPGGQAANVAAWVAELGGDSRFIGKRGADDAGALAASRLAGLGVELVGPIVPAANGVIVALVDPSGERTMCSDRGVASELRPEEVVEEWFEDQDGDQYKRFTEVVDRRFHLVPESGDTLEAQCGVGSFTGGGLHGVILALAPEVKE